MWQEERSKRFTAEVQPGSKTPLQDHCMVVLEVFSNHNDSVVLCFCGIPGTTGDQQARQQRQKLLNLHGVG